MNPSYLEELVVKTQEKGLTSVSRSIVFPADASLAPTGSILVRCIASIPDLYWQEAQVLLSVDVPEDVRRSPGYTIFGEYINMYTRISVFDAFSQHTVSFNSRRLQSLDRCVKIMPITFIYIKQKF